MASPGANELGIELIPSDEEPIDPADAVAAAAASAVDDPTAEVATDPPEPLGTSWAFDWERGEFRRQGSEPAEVHDKGALREWCLMAVHAARFAHPVFSDEFGLERPDDILGEIAVEELISDYEERLREALLIHDRITGVEEFSGEWDPATGQLRLEFEVVTDEEVTLPFGDVTLNTRGI